MLLMMALQGFSSTSRQVKQRLAAQGSPISMDMLFTALEEVRGWTRAASLRFINRGRELYRLANLRPEEVLSIHLYTGPMFMHYNAVLRRFPAGVLESMKGNGYVTTVHSINSAILKLSRATPMYPRFVYRGSSKMQLPEALAGKDRLGRMSIVDMGFLSLTGARDVAMRYAADGDLSMVLKVERGDCSSGAFIAGLSFYPDEEGWSLELSGPSGCDGNRFMLFMLEGSSSCSLS